MTAALPELTIVMPCLNEADTLESCVRNARLSIAELGLNAEVIVADNGSSDGSQQIADAAGARVVDVRAPGYGNALRGGIAAAHGKHIIMGDADGRYDFQEIGKFIERLREGYELVQGCRLPEGGGRILPGAMPFLHRWGNPMFSRLAQWWFGAPLHDVYCRLRGFTKELYDRLDLRCAGMDLATEMIIKATVAQAKMGEVPITLHPGGRVTRRPHLKTFRNGRRTLRFFLLVNPRWLSFGPGIFLVLLGILGYALALPSVTFLEVTFDAHTLLIASLWVLCGYQLVVFAIFTKTLAINEGLMPMTERVRAFFKRVTLERGLVASLVMLIFGVGLLLAAVNQWRVADFGRLDYAETMRLVIPGATLTIAAVQTMFSSFVISALSPPAPMIGVHMNPAFDEFAEGYEEALDKGISVSGEHKEFFAESRVDWLARRLHSLSFRARHVVDFGCGTGGSTSFLLRLPGVEQMTGLEVSTKSLEVARRLHGSDRTEFKQSSEFEADGRIDLVFCNGVFHHIPPNDRLRSLAFLFKALRPGGIFAMWENNPWNPGTRYVMDRIPFDRDAVPISPPEASRLFRAGGFDILHIDFLFIFPRFLRRFRRFEPPLARFPLGAQYLLLARKS